MSTAIKCNEVMAGLPEQSVRTEVPANFQGLAEQCNGGRKMYGGITGIEEMRANLRASCLPENLLDGEIPNYGGFLEQRRKLMAGKIKAYFAGL